MIIFLISGVAYIKFRNMDNYYLSLNEASMRMLISLSLILVLFAISTRLIIGNRFTIFMGKASAFIYIFQGVSLEITYRGIGDRYYPGIETLIVILVDLLLSISITHIIAEIKLLGR